MPFTFPTKPVVGQPGVGSDNWGTLLNAWIASAESAMNSNLSSLGTHNHDDRYYTETEISTWRNAVTQTEMGYLHGVTSAIQTQINGKAAASHQHQTDSIITALTGTPTLSDVLQDIIEDNAVPISLKTLSDWYNVMNPDVSGVTIQPYISNRYEGIRILCAADATIFVRTWEVIVKKNDVIIYQVSGASPAFFVDEGEGFEDGDALTVQIKLYTGTSTVVTSSVYSHTYTKQTSPDILALQAQLADLTLANIIDTLIQDDGALTAVCNNVASSNLLATKVAAILGA